MGYAQRNNAATRVELAGLTVAVDVQHLNRPAKPLDRGAVFTLANGTHTDEATATLGYSAALVAYLEHRGARVLRHGQGLTAGGYPDRIRQAGEGGAQVFIACHLNAGGGRYAAVEYMQERHPAARGPRLLADSIGLELARLVGNQAEAGRARLVALEDGQRGAVCVRGFAGDAVLVEPFFGDTPEHQPLFAAPELVRVGEAIGAGVAEWWGVVQRIPA